MGGTEPGAPGTLDGGAQGLQYWSAQFGEAG